jgi:hypothetical protein
MNNLMAADGATQLENVLINGDVGKLQPAERVMYYKAVCESVGLNPLTKPFEYLVLNGKTVLYARRDATDQLRKLHAVSIKIVSRDTVGDVFIVTAQATDRDGRTDEATGAIVVSGLKADALANAYMKAETKAKRRVTLSICGLGLLDETEIESPADVNIKIDEDVRPCYNDDAFDANYPKWISLIESGKKTADQIISTIESKARLSATQRDQILSIKVA